MNEEVIISIKGLRVTEDTEDVYKRQNQENIMYLQEICQDAY